MTKEEELIQTIKVLRQEVEVLTTRLEPAGTGYLITTIDTLNSRIDELMLKAIAPMLEEDGYEQHTEAMEQSRLRRIQDSAAGRKPNAVRDAYLHSSTVKDDVKHTEEYYDRNRNRAPDNEVWGGLSNRSMKQKHGQAAQTVSEMMQEELEPSNTFNKDYKY